MGKYEESKELLKKMLIMNSNLTMADRMISQTTKYDANHPHFLEMKKKLSDMKLDDNSLLHLHYALGKAYEDKGEYKKSFNHYKNANNIKYKINGSNIDNLKKHFLQIPKSLHLNKHISF